MTTVAANPRGIGQETGAFSPWRDLSPLPEGWRSLASASTCARAGRNVSRIAMRDSTGAKLTYGETFLRASPRPGTGSGPHLGRGPHVGLLVPPTVPAAVANLAVTLWGKIPVNLNYSASQSLVDSSIDQCGITHVLTSAKVLDRFKITPKGD